MGSSNERIESKITADVSRDEEPQKNFKCSNWEKKQNVIICIERSSPDYLKNFAENYEEFEDNDIAIVPIIISGAEAAKYYEE